MTFQNSFSSDNSFDSTSDLDNIQTKSQIGIKNTINLSNSKSNNKSDKYNSSINKTFLGSSAIDEKDSDQDSSSHENTDDSEIISERSKKDSVIFENDFQDDFSDEENNLPSINLISMEQIEKEVDELIKNDPIQKQDNENVGQDKPKFRVTFRPEVHEMAYRNYQRTQIQKQQERELLMYERLYGHYYFEEEEEEADFEPFEEDFIDKDQISSENDSPNINNENAIEESHYEKENDSALILNNNKIEQKDNYQLDAISNKEDKNHEDEKQSDLNLIQCENLKNHGSDTYDVEANKLQTNESEIENVPFIPTLDLSQFNSSKLISQSQTMNKLNKVNSTIHKPKRPVSSCSKLPECIIPATNKAHSKSHQNKPLSPQTKSSPPKSTPPVKLDQFENQNSSPNNNSNDNISAIKSPKSLLQQVQNKSTESKAEELRNNGFLITFLNSPHIANKQNKPISPKEKDHQQSLTSLLLSTATDPDTSTNSPNDKKDNINMAITKEKAEEEEEKHEIKKFTDEDLKKAIDDMLDHKILPPTEMHISLQVYIKNNIYKYIIDQDYDSAERLKAAQDMLSNGTSHQETNNERKMIIQSIENRIETTKDKIHEMKSQWTLKMEKFEDEIRLKSDELEQKQKEEVTKFEDTWNSNEILTQFNKPSAQLLEIRRMQRTKALSNDFAGARELKKRGDLLEKEETKRAERKAMESMKNAYNQLISKQQREFEYAKQNWQRQRNLIENERDQEIHSIELTLKQLMNKLNEYKSKPKSSNSNTKSRKLIIGNNNSAPTQNEKNKKSKIKRELKTPATTTPRTRKQIAKFRTQPRQEKLALNGLNVHKYVKSNSKVSSKGSVPHLIREKNDF